jgi:type II secretory pathway predicted ATPase ExeA
VAAGSARGERQIPPVAVGDCRIDVPQWTEERIVNDELFGLPLAPFSAVPDVNLFVETPGACEAIHLLTRSLLRDDGIAVLTGEVGVGKTMISKVLADRLSHKLRPLVLSSANFPTRRALYQSVLFSLGRDFVGLTEQEARLLVLESSREQLAKRGNLVLIIDEAHLLTDRLLEEIRSLISNVDEGRLLVQIVLIGHTSLKERLRDSRFVDLQHRIGCFAHVNPLNQDESTDYIRWRLELAGRDAFDIVTPGALQIITEIANGYPRCINILCDRAIGLAVESSSPIVDESLVRMALAELRQLPLVWNEPRSDEPAVLEAAKICTPSVSDDVDAPVSEREMIRPTKPAHAESSILSDDSAFSLATDLSPSEEWASFEIGIDWPSESAASEAHRLEGRGDLETVHGVKADEFEEIPVVDPYARFDAQLDSEQIRRPRSQTFHGTRTSEPAQDSGSSNKARDDVRTLAIVDVDQVVDDLEDEAPDARWIEEFVEESWPEISVLEAIHELRAGIKHAVTDEEVSSESGIGSLDSTAFEETSRPLLVPTQRLNLNELDDLDVEYDVVEPEPLHANQPAEAPGIDDQSLPVPASVRFSESQVTAGNADTVRGSSVESTECEAISANTFDMHNESAAHAEPVSRFAGLFTRLRRKRQAVADDLRSAR